MTIRRDLWRRRLSSLTGSVIKAACRTTAHRLMAVMVCLALGLVGCDLARPTGPTRLGFEMPGFDKWVKETAAMSVESQEAAVNLKFKELNPKRIGKTLPTTKTKGVVTGINLFDAGITDVSPLRAFVGLQNVGISEKSFTNLSPLEGLELEYVKCGNTQVSDLSPLKDMEIRSLDISNTPVSDLSPLKETELFSLNISGTQVSDLSPLRFTDLYRLDCKNSKVSDLSPLKILKLRELTCDFKPERDSAILRAMDTLERINGKPVAEFWKEVDAQNGSVKGPDSIVTQSDAQSKHDLSTSAGRFEQWVTETAALPAEPQAEAVKLKLKELNPNWPARSLVSSRSGSTKDGVTKWVVIEIKLESGLTDISPVRAFLGLDSIKISDSPALDLSPLKGRRLRSLDFNQMKVPDLTPLQEVKLDSLSFWDTNVPDLSPLNGRKLQSISFSRMKVPDLSLLKGLRLESLRFWDTTVPDLTPLKDMKLNSLSFHATNVPDLSPVTGLKLRFLSPLSDFSPFKDLELQSLSCNDTYVSDLSVLKGAPLPCWISETRKCPTCRR